MQQRLLYPKRPLSQLPMETDDDILGPMDAENESLDESQRTKKEKEKKKKKKKRKRLDVTMQVVREHPDKIAPLVGYFPSGFDPSGKGGDGDQCEPPPRVRVFRNTRKTGRLQLVVSPDDSKVEFVGTNYSGEAASAQLCTYALGVLDKDAGTLKIVPIASNKIFRLEPSVSGSYFPSEEPPTVVNELTAEQRADKINRLTSTYGTNKSISKAKKMLSLNQNEGSSAPMDSDRKLEGVVINKEALESVETIASRNIPPYDVTATTAEMAYPLGKIIQKAEWDYLLDILELLQAGAEAEVSPTAYPSFVCNRIYKLKDIEDEEKKTTLACILSYITHLIKFKDQHSMDGASSAKDHKIPAILVKKFSSMFADPALKKQLSEANNGLLISYVLVLTLFADDFRTDPLDIAKDLRMPAIKMRPHYEHLGCKLVRQNNVTYATLPVPLQFPKPRRRRR
ncbi:DNA-directed RNA polymerase I subunit rpa49 [Malania oleifera]|uniref:DNA-directed RNA polymerase I subunit rpa49 n=1 Tax=Malania oleifera TaxID=397392 RepID=UPI0025ADB95F|nr:DNA-directed RNA polymerase I subunit rpa49 [Malania oleifera]